MNEQFADDITLLRLLAKGGMGEVFLGIQKGAAGLERQVAVKRVFKHLANKKSFRAMFEREVTLGSKLQHPNIVQVIKSGERDGYLYYVMEYVEGKHVAQLIEKAIENQWEIPVPFICHIVAEIAKGLHYAHNLKDSNTGEPLQLVHRDISPANIMIGFNGAVKLVDFGIAKAANSLDLTRTGVLKGKFKYLAPERVTNTGSDSRSDIFSLGVVFYEMFARQHLFNGENSTEILEKIARSKQIDVSALSEMVPAPILEVLAKTLAPNPDIRFQNAEDIAVALEKLCNRLYPDFHEKEFRQIMQRYFPEESPVISEEVSVKPEANTPNKTKKSPRKLALPIPILPSAWSAKKTTIAVALCCGVIISTLGINRNLNFLPALINVFIGVPQAAKERAAKFEPLKVPNLVAWFDAQSAVRLPAEGAFLAKWPEAGKFQQSKAQSVPTMEGGKEKAALVFDGIDDQLSMPVKLKFDQLKHGINLAFVLSPPASSDPAIELLTIQDDSKNTLLKLAVYKYLLRAEVACGASSCFYTSQVPVDTSRSVWSISLSENKLNILQNRKVLLEQALTNPPLTARQLNLVIGANQSRANSGNSTFKFSELLATASLNPEVQIEAINYLAVKYALRSAIPTEENS
jgi:serine/threonine protein kinase